MDDTFCQIHIYDCECPLAEPVAALTLLRLRSPEGEAAHARHQAYIAANQARRDRQDLAGTIASAVGCEPDPAAWLAGVIGEAAKKAGSEALFRCAAAVAACGGEVRAA